jgi:hypothetical protein
MHIVGMGRNIQEEAYVCICFEHYPVPSVDWGDVAGATIDLLPEVALLEIFCFYMVRDDEEDIEAWHTLVHVCQKWRQVVFGSPRRLDLQLLCQDRTPVKEMLHVWPPFPIVIWNYCTDEWSVDHTIAALEHNDRIRRLDLESIIRSEFGKVLAVMQQPFPALTSLKIYSPDRKLPVVPASFLGGSAPRLKTLYLEGIPFPGLPKLLLSATHLVRLDLRGIPHSGFVSPDAMVTALSVSTRLETLVIRFDFPRRGNHPDWKRRHPPLLTHTVLPVLTKFEFGGFDDYLEDFVAWIDVPLLNTLDMTFFRRLMFDTPQLIHFISRTTKFHNARVDLSDWEISVTLSQTFDGRLSLGIQDIQGSSTQLDWQLSSLAQVCSLFFLQTFISAVERLDILENANNVDSELRCLRYIENGQWLDLLRPFTAVKDLYVTRKIAPHIASALRKLVGKRVTEVLPALQTLVFKEPEAVQEIIGPFIAARELARHPITISRWEMK